MVAESQNMIIIYCLECRFFGACKYIYVHKQGNVCLHTDSSHVKVTV